MILTIVLTLYSVINAGGIVGTALNPNAAAILFASEVQAVQVATVSAPEMTDRFRVELEARGLVIGG